MPYLITIWLWDKMEKNGLTQNHGTAWYQGTSLQQHQRVCRICQSDFWGHLQLWNNRGRPKTIYESSRAHLVPSQSFSRFFWKSLYFKIPKTVCCKPLILPMPTKTLRREADKRLFSGVAIHFITGFKSNFLYESSGKVGYATQLRWLT